MKKYKKLIMTIAMIPILMAIAMFFYMMLATSNLEEVQRITNIIFNYVKLAYLANIFTVIIIFVYQLKDYNTIDNFKRVIFLFIPASALAINLIIGFSLKLKNKGFLSWGSMIIYFSWGDIYENVKDNKINWSEI